MFYLFRARSSFSPVPAVGHDPQDPRERRPFFFTELSVPSGNSSPPAPFRPFLPRPRGSLAGNDESMNGSRRGRSDRRTRGTADSRRAEYRSSAAKIARDAARRGEEFASHSSHLRSRLLFHGRSVRPSDGGGKRRGDPSPAWHLVPGGATGWEDERLPPSVPARWDPRREILRRGLENVYPVLARRVASWNRVRPRGMYFRRGRLLDLSERRVRAGGRFVSCRFAPAGDPDRLSR